MPFGQLFCSFYSNRQPALSLSSEPCKSRSIEDRCHQDSTSSTRYQMQKTAAPVNTAASSRTRRCMHRTEQLCFKFKHASAESCCMSFTSEAHQCRQCFALQMLAGLNAEAQPAWSIPAHPVSGIASIPSMWKAEAHAPPVDFGRSNASRPPRGSFQLTPPPPRCNEENTNLRGLKISRRARLLQG